MLRAGSRCGLYLLSLVLCCDAAAQPSLLYKLAPEDLAAGDNFGVSVAADGNWLAVSASQDPPFVEKTGVIHVFDLASGQRARTIEPPPGVYTAFFGLRSMELRGDHLLVGNQFDDTHGSSAGGAYLYNLRTNTLERRFYASDAGVLDIFGAAVDFDDRYVLIGAHLRGSQEHGAAYLFDRSTGAELAMFTASDPRFGDNFGRRVALTDRYAVIGSHRKGPFDVSGFVDVFDLQTRRFVRRLVPVGLGEDSWFSQSLDAEGDRVLVGSLEDAAQLFDLNTGELVETFGDGRPDETTWLGYDLGLTPNQIVLGAYRSADGGTSSGAVWLIEGSGEGRSVRRIVNPDPQAFDLFGESVAVSGPYLIAGARGDDQRGNMAGAVYVYSIPEPGGLLVLAAAAIALGRRR